MNKTYLLALAATLASVPASTAAEPPKNYCEDPSDWGWHTYWVPATGLAVFLLQDSNVVGDCNGDTIPADFDGHSDFALGGAWLMVESGDGVHSGTLACYGEAGHHPAFGPITVADFVLGTTVPFHVESDTSSLTPPADPNEPNCGDFVSDESTTCVSTCDVTYPPGLDGVYIVYVGDLFNGAPGTGGRVASP